MKNVYFSPINTPLWDIWIIPQITSQQEVASFEFPEENFFFLPYNIDWIYYFENATLLLKLCTENNVYMINMI